MPHVDSNHFEEGEVASATDVNTVYSDIDAALTSIDNSNTRTEWVSLKHMNSSIVLVDMTPDLTFSGACSDEAYVPVGEVTGSWTFEPGDTIRLHANVEGGEHTVAEEADDDYFFQFHWTGSDGVAAPSTSTVGPVMGNSFLSRDDGGAGGKQKYNYQRCGMSYCWINNTANTYTITSLEIRVRVEHTDNEFTWTRGNFYALHIKRG